MQELGTITPTLEEFREYAATRRVVPVRMFVLADALTPVGLYRALVTRDGAARPGTFLLESAAEGGVWSRYSFVGARSVATLTARDGQAHWLGDAPSGAPTDGDPLEALRATMELLHTEPFEGVPRSPAAWSGSWAGRRCVAGRSCRTRPRTTCTSPSSP